ncbi:MAG: GTPase ObgE [Kiritimatiellia bacterium]
MKVRQFVDCVTISVRAGKGGSGSLSFRREAFVPKGGPDGGDGGRGGHVVLIGDHDEDSLLRVYFMPEIKAEDGRRGAGQRRTGRDGANVEVRVPCGTQVFNDDTGELVVDITGHGQRAVVARGGKGGWGNVHWKSSTNQAPREYTPGLPGEEFRLRLELKCLADVGLVGYPNAGKSSLLRALTAATPKVGAYPFTTLRPVIGTLVNPDYTQIRIADIPGLIEGAHKGVGLGVEFLRHLERTRVLAYVVDMAGVDGRTPWDDLRSLRREISLYDKALAKRPSMILANKMDLPGAVENLVEFRKRIRNAPIQVSALDRTGLDDVREKLRGLLQKAG